MDLQPAKLHDQEPFDVTQPPIATGSAFVLADTWTTTLKGSAGSYRVNVAVPASEPPAQGFPVLYLLDANAGFATVVETHRRLSRRPDATRVHPAIIVGIGHETDELYNSGLRQRDFAGSDGSVGFLDFIQHSVKALIQQHAPVDQTQQILAGHSLAGFFALWVLRNTPGAFQRYIALSPSLWSDLTLIEGLAAMQFDTSKPKVFLAVGEWEEGLAPWQAGQPGSLDVQARRQQRGMVSNVKRLGEMLQRHLGAANLQHMIFPDEDHASIFAVGMSRAMRMMLSTDTSAETQEV